ncbi:MAG: polysaccharide deacetylase family protein [Blastocatellia bacterium]|nr:polysaccharide deacetylase family protein [Blastocatellia bacterium]
MKAMTLNQIELLGKRSLKSLVAPLSWGWAETRKSWHPASNNDGQVQILAYHRIVADIEQAERNSIYGLVVSAKTFARHLELVRESYEFVTIDQALAIVRGEQRIGRAAALVTMDDGYQDVYDYAWPVLKQMGVPAIVYVPTALIGTTQLLDHDRLFWLVLKALEGGLDLREPIEAAGLSPERAARLCATRDAARVTDQLNYQPLAVRQPILESLEAALALGPTDYPSHYRLLDWAMIREMVDGGIAFGAHSDRHLILTLESEVSAEREIRRSKRVLEEQLNCPIRHFAYPNGYYNEAIRQMVEQAGFVSATTTERALAKCGDAPFALGRISLCEESTRGISGRFSEAVARLRLTV